jgi:hypothetical protein
MRSSSPEPVSPSNGAEELSQPAAGMSSIVALRRDRHRQFSFANRSVRWQFENDAPVLFYFGPSPKSNARCPVDCITFVPSVKSWYTMHQAF